MAAPRKARTIGQEVARELAKAAMTFRLSLTEMLARAGVDPREYYRWENREVADLYVGEYRRIMAAIDELRNDPARAIEAENEAIYNANFPLRKRTVK